MHKQDKNSKNPRNAPFFKSRRLQKQQQFDYLRKQGQSYVGRYCVLRVAPPADGCSRLAIVTSRRYSKKAVKRNRARRLLRQTYREVFPALQPVWMLMIPRSALKNASYQDVYHDFLKLAKTARLLIPEADEPKISS